MLSSFVVPFIAISAASMSPIRSYTHFADGYCSSVEEDDNDVTLLETFSF